MFRPVKRNQERSVSKQRRFMSALQMTEKQNDAKRLLPNAGAFRERPSCGFGTVV